MAKKKSVTTSGKSAAKKKPKAATGKSAAKKKSKAVAGKSVAKKTLPRHAQLGLSAGDCAGLYEHMLRNRFMDDAVSSLYQQNKIPGGAFSSRGQEATSVGSAWCLEDGDIIGPMIRNSGALTTRGLPVAEVLANFLGRAPSPTGGRDGNTHLSDLSRGIFAPISHLSTLIPVCSGAALAFKLRGEKRVAMTWTGDGATSLGDFHEGINNAAVWRLPLIVIIENNGYAYSTPTEKQSLLTDLSKKALGYGIPGASFDGNDVLEVVAHVRPAVKRARSGKGPTLLESRSFRMKGHAEHDNAWYVPKRLRASWEKKDPIARFEKYLARFGVLDAKGQAEIRDRVRAEVNHAREEALSRPWPDPATVADGVYA